MKNVTFKLIWAFFLIYAGNAQAQNWQLTWSDEFTNGISSDWVFETGRGSNGWGNNELQYYRRENATIENGQLVITAKREDFGGAQYTSVRMKTQGKKSWKYGKIEARIAMPSFQGVWPAFWMLGDNISSVGWPSCGEIDVMEHVNTGGNVHGTIHWSDQSGAYANYGGNTTTNITSYHLYTVEWDANAILWFIDGVKYHEVNIANGVNGTSEFHNNFFILLNMAIGGNWPGFSVDNGALPARMMVDYVRVYQAGVAPPQLPQPPVVTGVTNLSGSYWLQNRLSGLNLDVAGNSSADGANIHQWTANSCTCQQFEFTHLGGGTYKIIAKNSGKSLDVADRNTANGANVLQWPYTGATNQQFTVISTGDGFYKIMAKHSGKLIEVAGFSTSAGGNVQQWADAGQRSAHWKLTPVVPAFSRLIQAESYFAMNGVQLEPTTDANGGQNVGYIDAGDWMAYQNINFPTTGSYRIEYRVAGNGGRVSLDLNAGSIQLGAIDLPTTSGWQSWTTVSQIVNVNAGTYNLGLFAARGGWNLNWINITRISGARLGENDPALAASFSTSMIATEATVYPNPARDRIYFEVPSDFDGVEITVFDLAGKLCLTSSYANSLDISSLENGMYQLVLISGEEKINRSFLKF